jgi:hypothetical protein
MRCQLFLVLQQIRSYVREWPPKAKTQDIMVCSLNMHVELIVLFFNS